MAQLRSEFFFGSEEEVEQPEIFLRMAPGRYSP